MVPAGFQLMSNWLPAGANWVPAEFQVLLVGSSWVLPAGWFQLVAPAGWVHLGGSSWVVPVGLQLGSSWAPVGFQVVPVGCQLDSSWSPGGFDLVLSIQREG